MHLHWHCGHSWDRDCRTWKNWWYSHLLQLDTVDRIIDVLLVGASPSSVFWVSVFHHLPKQSQYHAYLWKKLWLLDRCIYIPVSVAEKIFCFRLNVNYRNIPQHGLFTFFTVDLLVTRLILTLFLWWKKLMK